MTSWVHSTTTACSGDFVHTNTASAHMMAAQIQFEKKKLKLPQRVCMCFRYCALNDPGRMKVKAINCPYLWREVINRDFMMKTGRRGHREREIMSGLLFLFSSLILSICVSSEHQLCLFCMLCTAENLLLISPKRKTRKHNSEIWTVSCLWSHYIQEENVNLEHFLE